MQGLAKLLPLGCTRAFYLLLPSVVPLLGSAVTEPAAMTLAALLLRDRYFVPGRSARFMFTHFGWKAAVVFAVNAADGDDGFAAPPVLMVTRPWGLGLGFCSGSCRPVPIRARPQRGPEHQSR